MVCCLAGRFLLVEFRLPRFSEYAPISPAFAAVMKSLAVVGEALIVAGFVYLALRMAEAASTCMPPKASCSASGGAPLATGPQGQAAAARYRCRTRALSPRLPRGFLRAKPSLTPRPKLGRHMASTPHRVEGRRRIKQTPRRSRSHRTGSGPSRSPVRWQSRTGFASEGPTLRSISFPPLRTRLLPASGR